MLERNKATLRRLDVENVLPSRDPQTEESVRLLMQCPLLEQISFPRDSLKADLVEIFDSALWPNMRSMRLSAPHHMRSYGRFRMCGFAMAQMARLNKDHEKANEPQLARVLERGFAPSLTSLRFDDITSKGLAIISALRFPALENLKLPFDRCRPEDAELLAKLFTHAPNITELDITNYDDMRRRGSYWLEDSDDEALPLPEFDQEHAKPPISWNLPKLREFFLVDFPVLPLLVAPQLESMNITLSVDAPDVKQALIPTLMGSDKLQRVRVVDERKQHSHLAALACAMFADELVVGGWPQLDSIEVFPSSDFPAIIQSLIKRPRPGLKVFSCRGVESARQCRDFLAAHTQLELATLIASNSDTVSVPAASAIATTTEVHVLTLPSLHKLAIPYAGGAFLSAVRFPVLKNLSLHKTFLSSTTLLAKACPMLHRLTLSDVNIHEYGNPSEFSALTRLSTSPGNGWRAADRAVAFVRFVCALPQLEELRIGDSTHLVIKALAEHLSQTTDAKQRLPSLKSLTLNCTLKHPPPEEELRVFVEALKAQLTDLEIAGAQADTKMEKWLKKETKIPTVYVWAKPLRTSWED